MRWNRKLNNRKIYGRSMTAPAFSIVYFTNHNVGAIIDRLQNINHPMAKAIHAYIIIMINKESYIKEKES